MPLSSPPTHNVSLRPQDILSDGDAVCSVRLGVLQQMLRKAFMQSSSVTLSLEGGMAPDIRRDILSQLAGLLTLDSDHMWASVRQNELVLRDEPPQLSWADIRHQLHGHAGGLNSHPQKLLERADRCWDEHLTYTNAHLRDEMRNASRMQGKKVSSLTPERTESRIRGRSAEFILQMVLERYAENFGTGDTPPATLVDRSHGLVFPKPQSGRAYRWHPTTFHNGELKMTERIANTHARQRHRPMSTSDCTLTEFDAAVLTNLSSGKRPYGTMFLFDATTSSGELSRKMLLKPTKIMPFIDDMKEEDVSVEIINVLMSDGRHPFADTPPDAPGSVRAISLPLAELVDAITKRTACELGQKIPE